MAANNFSFGRDNLGKALRLPWFALLALLALLATLVRRNSKIWVFGRRSGVGDGPLAVALELRERCPGVRVIWITLNASDEALAASYGISYARKGSLLALRSCLRAGSGFMTHGFSDLCGPAIWGARVVQLWHGAPLKRIGLDRLERVGRVRCLLRRASAVFERYWNGHYSWLVAGSDVTGERLQSGLGVRPGAVLSSGDPRMDLVTSFADKSRAALCELAMSKGISGSCYVLVAPTWRDNAEASVTLDAESQLLLSSREDIVLFVRAHPHSAEMNSLRGVGNVVALPSGEYPDITAMLGAFDALMTDYSSIAMDFAVTGRPLVLVAPDLDEYVRSPGLYESYEQFSSGLGLQTWSEGFVRLATIMGLDDGPMRRMHEEASLLMGRRYHPRGTSGNASRLLDALDCPYCEGVS